MVCVYTITKKRTEEKKETDNQPCQPLRYQQPGLDHLNGKRHQPNFGKTSNLCYRKQDEKKKKMLSYVGRFSDVVGYRSFRLHLGQGLGYVTSPRQQDQLPLRFPSGFCFLGAALFSYNYTIWIVLALGWCS